MKPDFGIIDDNPFLSLEHLEVLRKELADPAWQWLYNQESDQNRALNRAAAWWREKLSQPDGPAKFDNGDPTSSRLAQLAAATSPVPANDERSLAKFEQLLRVALATGVGLGRQRVNIGVDYHPDKVLAEVAHLAGIDNPRFPWKTTMWVSVKPHDTYVAVSCGYGAPFERLPL